MTTASTNTTVSNATNAAFIAWIQEVLTNLITNCGLTQTSDTGQITSSMSPPVVNAATTVPSANTSAGYVILRFNDTLQSTAPIFIKLEFGIGGTTSVVSMWVTIGTASNGSGTISGTGLARTAIGNAQSISSTVTNYVSRYCYNATQGVLWMGFKTAGGGSATQALAGFVLYRTVDSTGAPTATGAMFLGPVAAGTTTGAASAGSQEQINYTLSTSTAIGNGTATGWVFIPGGLTGTLEGSSCHVFPLWQYASSSSASLYGITNAAAMCVAAELSLGSTMTATLIGSTSLTYINAGSPIGVGGFATTNYSVSTYGLALLWQ